MKLKEDRKNYVYLRIEKKEWEKVIQQDCISSILLKKWREEYKFKNINRRTSAEWANKIKQKKVLEKIVKVLDTSVNGLFAEDLNKLTTYKLAKLAGINYLTAQKYWEKRGLKEKFLKDPVKTLKELNELKELH